MARNQVMKLWTAIVTAFLALCTTLGLVTTTAAAAVPQPEPERNTSVPASTLPELSLWGWSPTRSADRGLPPTMKQRIRAEAHGSSPACRHRPSTDTTAFMNALTDSTAATDHVDTAGSASMVGCHTGTQ
ncbi:DUF6344 domain-containing protein [Streptomyces siamensis]|uniref:DUF6344 domain-containing protein n=1 Tax=Streptomyces siamensis TaxID=1274986 RepID=A0ABP9ID98_9ACTN